MIRNALWRTYDSSYGAAKSLLAWSGLGKAYNLREQVARWREPAPKGFVWIPRVPLSASLIATLDCWRAVGRGEMPQPYSPSME